MRTWIRRPDARRVAQNRKWKTAAGNSIANHINFALMRNPQDLLMKRAYGALMKSRRRKPIATVSISQ
jgi:hypothetical protein